MTLYTYSYLLEFATKKMRIRMLYSIPTYRYERIDANPLHGINMASRLQERLRMTYKLLSSKRFYTRKATRFQNRACLQKAFRLIEKMAHTILKC